MKFVYVVIVHHEANVFEQEAHVSDFIHNVCGWYLKTAGEAYNHNDKWESVMYQARKAGLPVYVTLTRLHS